jgi:kynurenine formamidase
MASSAHYAVVPEPRVSADEFARLFESVKTWGQWGPHDERGTLNELTPERTRAAGALIRSGRTVSLSVPVNKEAGPDNPRPAIHYMTMQDDVDVGEPRWNFDFIGIDYHGNCQSHIDALCHCVYRGQLYNGVSPRRVTSQGATVQAITAAEHGIVTRGVLLDVPRLRGTKWLEPGTAILPEELAACERAQDVRVGAGDVVMVRLGQHRIRLDVGPWPSWDVQAGLHPSCMPWLKERRVAVLGSDGDSDALPSPVEGVAYPIHALALAAMGLHLLDNLNFEDLAVACAEEARWEFLCVVAPLRLPGGTGSPCNPIAVF